MDDDFLTRLDAAVDQRCSCPCGAPITDRSPSAWFAAETCSKAWHRAANPESRALDGTGPIASVLAMLRSHVMTDDHVIRDETHRWPNRDHTPHPGVVMAMDYDVDTADRIRRESEALKLFFEQLVRDFNRVFGDCARHIREWLRSNGFDDDVQADSGEPADVLTRVIAARRRRNTGPPPAAAVPASRCAGHDSRAAGGRRMWRGQVPYTRR